MLRADTVRLGFTAAAILLSGCTVISGAGDYEVADPAASTRDLDYEFVGMIAHAGIPLDVAVVDQSNLLQARARIILPPVADGEYPSERLVMKKALTPGEQTLYFFADNDGNGLVAGEKRKIVEHIWIEPLDSDGIGEFVHNTSFDYFNEDAYIPIGGALVLQMPAPRTTDVEALLECLDGKFGRQLDVTLTLIEQERQVGLFRRYRGTKAPEEVRLGGVLDGGSQYRIEVSVDGEIKKTLTKQAPASDDLIVPAGEWLPIKLEDAVNCR